MKDEISIKDRLKTILWCLVAMSILGSIAIVVDPKLNEHIYLLVVPFAVAISSAIGVIIIYLKTKEPLT